MALANRLSQRSQRAIIPPLDEEESMSLTRAQVQHIAELAKLNLGADEIDRMTQQLSAILDYAARLQALASPRLGQSRVHALCG